MNGGRPVSSSKSRQPVEYRSERASTVSPRACSGDRYCAVPMTACVCVIVAAESARARAMPKSMTLTAPVGVSMTFAGLMSRCTMPAWCEYSSADSTPAAISTASSMGTAWPSRRMSRTVWPSTYSMTMNGTCATTPVGSVNDVLAGVVDRDDRGVVQRGRGLRLAAEPGLERGVAGQVGAQDLDGHGATEPGVVADVHLGHAAAADELADLVPAGEDPGSVVHH